MITARYTIGMALFLTVCVLTLSGVHGENTQQTPHKKIRGVVVDQGGQLAVQTAEGMILQLNTSQSRLRGHNRLKAGDKVVILLDEHGDIIKIQSEGSERDHRFVTGKLVQIRKDKKQIKLQTKKGYRTFSVDKEDVKRALLLKGSEITVELSKAGRVIDFQPSKQ
jgi:hypothetical protein